MDKQEEIDLRVKACMDAYKNLKALRSGNPDSTLRDLALAEGNRIVDEAIERDLAR